MKDSYPLIFILLSIVLLRCDNKNQPSDIIQNEKSIDTITSFEKPFPVTEDFKNYWYAGKAEITSYDLQQARYGEIREGEAVLIFVTEPFLGYEQVKADDASKSNVSVLKLNATKNFNTGIYPYSIMQSTFFPLDGNPHALKVTCSVQEWCGQVYMQLNNREEFDVMSHSYFEDEGDEEFSLDQVILENELWTKLRIDPKTLPTGEIMVIPAFEFLRLRHVPIKAYQADAIFSEGNYKLTYPDLERSLTIDFNPEFPYEILGWEETFISGFGKDAKSMTSIAIKKKTIRSDYWTKNKNSDGALRDSLQLR